MDESGEELSPFASTSSSGRSRLLVLLSDRIPEEEGDDAFGMVSRSSSAGYSPYSFFIPLQGSQSSRSTRRGRIQSLFQMLTGTSDNYDSSESPLALPPPTSSDEGQGEQLEVKETQGHKSKDTEKEIKRLKEILENGGKRLSKEKGDNEESEVKVKTRQEDKQKVETTEDNPSAHNDTKMDEVEETNDTENELETTLQAEVPAFKGTDISDLEYNYEGHAVTMATVNNNDESLPLSQQLRKDVDKSMDFLKSLWSPSTQDFKLSDGESIPVVGIASKMPGFEMNDNKTKMSFKQKFSQNNIYLDAGKTHTDNISYNSFNTFSRSSSCSLSEDGVTSPGISLPPISSKNVLLPDTELSDCDSVEGDSGYSNDLGKSLHPNDLDKGSLKVKGQSLTQVSQIELPTSVNDKNLFKSKCKFDTSISEVEECADALKRLEKEDGKGVNSTNTGDDGMGDNSKNTRDDGKGDNSKNTGDDGKGDNSKNTGDDGKGDNSKNTEDDGKGDNSRYTGDVGKRDDSKNTGDMKPEVKQSDIDKQSQRSKEQYSKSALYGDYYGDYGTDYDERYGYTPTKGKYSRLAKNPFASQLTWLTGYMTGMHTLAEQNNFEIKDVLPDGNCMFSAIVDQLRICGNFDYNTQTLRKAAVSYLRENPHHEDGTHLQSFLYRDSWDTYLKNMEQETVWGDHMVLQACTEVLACKIHVYKVSTNKTVLEPNSTEANEASDLYLGHVGESHFVSLRPISWEAMWHLKAQIHKMKSAGRKNASRLHKLYKKNKRIREKVAQMVESNTEEVSDKRKDGLKEEESLPKEDKRDEVGASFEQEVTSPEIKSNAASRQSSVTSEQDKSIDAFVEEINLEDDKDNLGDIEEFQGCSDVKTLVEDPNAFDNDSQLPLLHLSYLIKNVLRSNYMCTLSDASVELAMARGSIQSAGSVPEGLNIFLMNYNRKKKDVVIDTIQKFSKLIGVDAQGQIDLTQDGIKGCHDFILEDRECHKGYTHLRPFRPDLWSKQVYMTDNHKPLIMHRILSFSNRSSVPGRLLSKNAFSGFKFKEWPNDAKDWFTRERPSGWPNKEKVSIIKSTDCLAISRGHPATETPGIEWQIIFPQAEQILAKECLDKHQRYCFSIFKIYIDYHCRQQSTQLSTTHLKTVLFYACEEIPIHCWSENIGGCILFLLDKLLMFLMTRNLPNYFIPGNNMIDHIGEKDLKYLEEKVYALRIFPAMALYILSEEHGIHQISILLDPILDDAKKYRKDRSKSKTTQEVFVRTTMKLAMYFMEYEHYSEGCNIAQKAYEETLPLESSGIFAADKGDAFQIKSFQDFILEYLDEEDDECKYTIAYEFDKRLQTSLLRALQKGQDSLTMKDIIGKEEAGNMADVPIPKSYSEDTLALVKYLDEYARMFWMKRKYEDSACFLRCAIKKAKSFEQEMVDVSQVEDQEVKNKVTKQNYRNMERMNCKLMNVYNHLYTVYFCMNQVELIQEYIHDYEAVCEKTGHPYYYEDVADVWLKLGCIEKSEEVRRKMKCLQAPEIPEETWI